MLYSGYNGVDIARLMVATSFDLTEWGKKGKAFGDHEPKTKSNPKISTWSKSGAIVTKISNFFLIIQHLI